MECPICRENHEPRGLSFDGKGVNSCGMYRTRLATMTKDVPESLGPVFAAAPDLLAACKVAGVELAAMHTEYCCPCNGGCPTLCALAQINAAIAKAEGGGA